MNVRTMNSILDFLQQRVTVAAFASLLLASLIGIDAIAADTGARSSLATSSATRLPLIRIPLPIVGEADRRLKAAIDQLLERLPANEARPTLVLEFRASESASGRGSEFERALSLARYLAGERLGRVRTVAFVSGPLAGHAVLPVLACEQIVVHPDADFGKAGVDELFIDATQRSGYQEIAQRRRTVPAAVALGMLDPALIVYQAETLDGVRYVLDHELQELQKNAVVRSMKKLVAEGELGHFSGSSLRLEHAFASHLARDRRELATVLGFSPQSIDEDPTLLADRRALRIDLTGPIKADTVNWVERSLRQHLDSQQTNFVLLTISSPGGSPLESVRLAALLASLDPGQVRTVAVVTSEARGDAALIALACDQLAITDNAVLGGPGARRIDKRRLDDLKTAIRDIVARKQRDWSWMLAMVDPELQVSAYTRAGTAEQRYFCREEWQTQPDKDEWKAGTIIDTTAGIRGRVAAEVGLARAAINNADEYIQTLQLDGELTTVSPNWAHRLIEFLAQPHIAGTLLFVAWFALIIELMSPGLSFAGFISGLSFLLFFWSHFLHGTAGWLEVLLFAAGIACLTLEIFVLPGFGVFGVGGGLLLVISLVLASQTFIIPRNSYELRQLPSSMLMVAAAGLGALMALFFMRRMLRDAPVIRRLALDTPEGEELYQQSYREALVHYEHLRGKHGVTTTQLTPSGKARIGDEIVDVISDGMLIARGIEVFVADVKGNEVLVRPIDDQLGA
jgi:membrane-bound serine protease (ClpP class)